MLVDIKNLRNYFYYISNKTGYTLDGNGNLVSKTDEDGYVTEYSYSPVNLVSGINYSDKKQAAYLYNGTGELIEMTDWNGTTTFERDLLNRLVKVTDHDGNVVEYGWDNVGNKTVRGYPDGTQAERMETAPTIATPGIRKALKCFASEGSCQWQLPSVGKWER